MIMICLCFQFIKQIARLNPDFVIQGLRQRARQFALPDAEEKPGAQSRALFHAPVQGTRPDDEHGKLN